MLCVWSILTIWVYFLCSPVPNIWTCFFHGSTQIKRVHQMPLWIYQCQDTNIYFNFPSIAHIAAHPSWDIKQMLVSLSQTKEGSNTLTFSPEDRAKQHWKGERRWEARDQVHKLTKSWFYTAELVGVTGEIRDFYFFTCFFFWRLLGARGSIQSFTLSSNRFLGALLRKYLALSAQSTILRNST